MVHMSVRCVSAMKPLQNYLLLSGQKLVVMPMYLVMVFFWLKLTLLSCCIPQAPSFARMSTWSFSEIATVVAISSRKVLLVAAACCRALVEFRSSSNTLAGQSGCFRGRQPAYNYYSEAWSLEAKTGVLQPFF